MPKREKKERGRPLKKRYPPRVDATAEQMAEIVRGMFGKRLRYADLIGPEYTRLNTQLGLA